MESETTSAVLITGAASGLGAAFLHHYARSKPMQEIMAIDRSSISVPSGIANGIRIRTFTVDVTDPESISALEKSLENTAISLVLHCAGVRGLVPSIVRDAPGDVAAAETLQVMDKQTMRNAFEINCIGTLQLIRALIPNLQLYARIQQHQPHWPPPRCIVLGSRMGSVSANKDGGGYAYRASKAALNAIIRSLSIDVKDVVFTILHPGRVETGLVDWKEEGAICPAESVRDCVELIDVLSLEESGGYLDRFGNIINW